ncbi:hypothetical protein TraAM80_01318 [Trypanosoma rangeli]|uniref:Uncharacterized protein n=1 Tax=Trypanosoma rangeli TaxID=5698 RepID=A0A3R7KVW9_TRYRA|nr:uncharacterized protein TraAM80_01318 [Trypanosoma rangeli]RNF10757.1 hypothetical protein TraAM80_01318 [Trypanosoma rangeli]|eukprot:RNF10757.1 hypothetical protein TraAM80_01318 [Trypanosoma rangeli]
MRRVTGEASEAKDLDARWLLYRSPASPNPTKAVGGFLRLGRFRPWHIKHDGYSYLHCIAMRNGGADGFTVEAERGASAALLSAKQAAGKKKNGASPTAPLPRADAASQKTGSGAVTNNPTEVVSDPGSGK